MPASACRYRMRWLRVAHPGRGLARLCCLAALSACVWLPALGFGQATHDAHGAQEAAAPVGRPVQLPDEVSSALPAEVQAKLSALSADLKAAEAHGDAAGEARLSHLLGDTYFGVSEYAKALEAYRRALERARTAGDAAQQAAAWDGIGRCYRARGQAEKAEEAFAQALRFASVRGRAGALDGLGGVSADRGQNRRALACYRRALPLARRAGDRQLQADILRSIGVVFFNSGDFRRARSFFDRALVIWREVGDRSGESATLSNIGSTYDDLGEKQKALEYYRQALAISQQAGDRAREASTLNNIGIVYSDLSDKEKALEYYRHALAISRRLSDSPMEAKVLNNIGIVYSHTGEYAKALDSYQQALAISRQVGNLAGAASTLNSIGHVYDDLGEKQKALDGYNQALGLSRRVGNRALEALVLNNLGGIYSDQGDLGKALRYFKQALPIERQTGYRQREAGTLSNMADVHAELGRKQQALQDYLQALSIWREVGDRDGEAETLNNIGDGYASLGRKRTALEYFGQALPLAVSVDDPQLEDDVLRELFAVEKADHPSLAILYGKLAINLLQQLRINIRGLDEGVQSTFLSTIADQYHELAALLMQQGRLPEAQQVLNLLKVREYQEYSRGNSGESLGVLSLSPAEQSAQEDYRRSTATLMEQGRRWSELKQTEARTAEQDREFQQLSDVLGHASRLMNDYFGRLYKLFSEGGDANRQVAVINDETASLQRQIAKMPGTVVLYTVVSKDRYSVMVISGSAMVARESAIPAEELYRKVADFRRLILDPSQDPGAAAEELYRILVGPIKADLEQAQARTLIWSLDGVLRYVPLAALYDGRHYLVEDYSLANLTPVSIPRLSEKPDLAAVRAVGMGISVQLEERLKPLPMVETELESIVNDPQTRGAGGVVPGTILLNAQFTEPEMERRLDGQRTIVHIASHFVMRPGDDSWSYLLMAGADGGSYHMSVADFRDNRKLSLEGTELFTLSACDTGIGGSAANGREVDGLATTAQRKGAKAVISSLWQLNDTSTALLMSDFYKRWVEGGGRVMKAEALRQAQLDLLHGRAAAAQASASPEADAGYARPYYWAPFVLTGNWQ